MRRALFLLLVFAPLGQRDLAFGPLALGQIGPPRLPPIPPQPPPIGSPSLSCNAQEVRFDFSANVSGGFTAPDGVFYPRAGLPGYLSFLDTLPPTQRFLPTQVVGTQDAFVTCIVTVPRSGGGGGSLCGAGPDWCLRLRVAGSLPPPLAKGRVYVLGRVGPGSSGRVRSHVPTPTPLSSIPDGGGLFSISPGRSRIPFAFLEIWIFLELAASDSYTGPYSGSLLFTYVIQDD